MHRLFLLLLVLLLATAGAWADSWPAKPIKFIVSLAAGGTPDIICRLIADKLSRTLGQQVVVENRPGGGNVIGAQAVARAAPDGYTFLFATAATLVTNPHTFKHLPYDPARDFAPVGMVGSNPFVLLAHPSVAAGSLPALIAQDQQEPGKLTVATDGQRNFSGLLIAWLNKRAGMGIVQVPYATMPQGVQDAIAGRVQLVVLAVASAAPLMQRGQLHGIAVSSAKRLPDFESISTFAETLPGFELTGWFALVAPARTPVEVIRHMNRALDAALADPEVSRRMSDVGMYSEGAGMPEATAAYVHDQLEVWGGIVRGIGLQPE
jgi:tripartite-type tricarboxylate transporter receptor subunit TctC